MREMLTGRILETPAHFLDEEVLKPQFTYEVEYLLPMYIQIEQAMLLEYVRMGWINEQEAQEISRSLESINPDRMIADPEQNMSDIAFAIERLVESSLSSPVPGWHMDRSRNDFQACAQVMSARKQWMSLMEYLRELIKSIHMLAERYREIPMPGYTHYQTAQIITPGYYLTAINEELLQTLSRWIQVYDELNQCPLGSGAMSGVELDWNRDLLARLLGFRQPRANALTAVASREWMLRISSELSVFSVLISRFVTDLIQWGSSEMNFIDLPDRLSGISSAMPQKKNFPILERIRGKSAHLSAFHMDMVLGQRNTSFTNLVEVSKEAGTHLSVLFQNAKSLLRLLTLVTDHLSFKEEEMLAICERDFFGGFTLANRLTMEANIPYRKSQIIVGRYIMHATQLGLTPMEVNPQLLKEKCMEEGFDVSGLADMLTDAFDVQGSLYTKRSDGSTHPEKVSELLLAQKERAQNLEEERGERQAQLRAADLRREQLLHELAPTENGKG
ncbi:argininosuccinate lyase [Kroppenstedtia guangzhouensis]|jgi:argininosuccinate lyase|uniref:argininosuccinate lyase n=1 Tax=Kroppenstedtia guangzhouensis TaxID=1274356 RepID=A0ABQ1GYQ8_9BACL|nr:lyase family protein [Kroppenstedtia guangzhouensis]GGA52619.1 argininosuccinate lyase [Kroppenstedtia guangzhouensis]